MMQPCDNSDHSWLVIADWMDDNQLPFADELRRVVWNPQLNCWEYQWGGVGGVGVGGGVGGVGVGGGVGGVGGVGVGGVGGVGGGGVGGGGVGGGG